MRLLKLYILYLMVISFILLVGVIIACTGNAWHDTLGYERDFSDRSFVSFADSDNLKVFDVDGNYLECEYKSGFWDDTLDNDIGVYYISKYSPNNVLLWKEECFREYIRWTDYSMNIKDIVIDNNGNYLICGRGAGRGVLIKMTNEGEILWTYWTSGGIYFEGKSTYINISHSYERIFVDKNNNYVVSGIIRQRDADGFYYSNYRLIMFTSEGNNLFATLLPYSWAQEPMVTCMGENNDNYVFAGTAMFGNELNRWSMQREAIIIIVSKSEGSIGLNTNYESVDTDNIFNFIFANSGAFYSCLVDDDGITLNAFYFYKHFATDRYYIEVPYALHLDNNGEIVSIALKNTAREWLNEIAPIIITVASPILVIGFLVFAIKFLIRVHQKRKDNEWM